MILNLASVIARKPAPMPAVVQQNPMATALAAPGGAPAPVAPRPIQIQGPRSDALAKALMGSGLQNETIETPIEAIGKLAQLYGGKRAEERFLTAQDARAQAEKDAELAGYASIMEQGGESVNPMVKALILSGNPDLAKFGVQQMFEAPPERPTFTQNGIVYDMQTRQPLIEGSQPPKPTPYTDPAKVQADLDAGLISETQAADAFNKLQVADAPTPHTDYGKIMADLESGLITEEQANTAMSQMRASPLITPEDRAAQGIKPDDTAPYWLLPDNTVTGIKGGPSATVTNVIGGDTPADQKLRDKLSEKEGERWSELKSAGEISAGTAQDMEVLGELLKMAPQGPIIGTLAEAFPGFSAAGSAFESVVKRIAPSLRTPGSGSTSDIEYAGMLQSLPKLSNHPLGNQVIHEMMRAKAEINIARGAIVTAYENKQLTADEARTKMAELNSRSIMTDRAKALMAEVGGAAPAAGGGEPLAPGEYEWTPEGLVPVTP